MPKHSRENFPTTPVAGSSGRWHNLHSCQEVPDLGGRAGGKRRAVDASGLARRLEAAVGKEYARTLLEFAETLTIFEAQLERGEYRDVRSEMVRLSRALKTTARQFRS